MKKKENIKIDVSKIDEKKLVIHYLSKKDLDKIRCKAYKYIL